MKILNIIALCILAGPLVLAQRPPVTPPTPSPSFSEEELTLIENVQLRTALVNQQVHDLQEKTLAMKAKIEKNHPGYTLQETPQGFQLAKTPEPPKVKPEPQPKK